MDTKLCQAFVPFDIGILSLHFIKWLFYDPGVEIIIYINQHGSNHCMYQRNAITIYGKIETAIIWKCVAKEAIITYYVHLRTQHDQNIYPNYHQNSAVEILFIVACIQRQHCLLYFKQQKHPKTNGKRFSLKQSSIWYKFTNKNYTQYWCLNLRTFMTN